MSSLRVALVILGLALLTVAIVNFIYLQLGGKSEDSQEYQSAATSTPASSTPADITTPAPVSLTPSGLPSETPLAVTPVPPTVPPTEEVSLPTQEALLTEEAETSEEVYPPPGTPVPLPSPANTPSAAYQQPLFFQGAPVASLGVHIVQCCEHLFCIGRAYGVLPQAIAEANYLPLNAPLFFGQELQIPDVPWVNIPPGPICKPQFKSPYAPPSVSMISTPPSSPLGIPAALNGPWRGEAGSLSGQVRLINFVLPKGRVNEVGSPFVSLTIAPATESAGEIRRVKVGWPDKMFLAASGVVTLSFYPEQSNQAGVSGTPLPGQPTPPINETPDSNQLFTNPEPLVIPDVFDSCDVFATAHLDAIAFSYSPKDDMVQPVYKGEAVTWHWSIKPQDVEEQKLIISLYLNFKQKPNVASLCNNGQPLPSGQIWAAPFSVEVQKPWFDLYTGYILGVLGIITAALPLWNTFIVGKP
jgi:hypothetical protein